MKQNDSKNMHGCIDKAPTHCGPCMVSVPWVSNSLRTITY